MVVQEGVNLLERDRSRQDGHVPRRVHLRLGLRLRGRHPEAGLIGLVIDRVAARGQQQTETGPYDPPGHPFLRCMLDPPCPAWLVKRAERP